MTNQETINRQIPLQQTPKYYHQVPSKPRNNQQVPYKKTRNYQYVSLQTTKKLSIGLHTANQEHIHRQIPYRKPRTQQQVPQSKPRNYQRSLSLSLSQKRKVVEHVPQRSSGLKGHWLKTHSKSLNTVLQTVSQKTNSSRHFSCFRFRYLQSVRKCCLCRPSPAKTRQW